ncbi:hypothetical protein HAX54_004617 [Datura stramonium]|uniref:Uncharacterized protein n=1 Tax=Datura stramonium TaxID=4076 RepID=A0ABS8T795_DATST|nr:hypothetical protein [Datura stramonium]
MKRSGERVVAIFHEILKGVVLLWKKMLHKLFVNVENVGNLKLLKFIVEECAMASHINKSKEVATSRKGFKRLTKEAAPSSSAPKAPPARRFRAQDVEEHGLKWFNSIKRLNTTLRTGLMKDD